MDDLDFLSADFGPALAIGIVPAAVALLQIIFLLCQFTFDSPKYLHSRGNTVESLKALNSIYNNDTSITDEFKALSETKDDVNSFMSHSHSLLSPRPSIYLATRR